MIPAKHIEVKTATGQSAAFLSPKADGLKDVYSDYRLNGESTLEFLLPATSEKIAELTPECQIWAGGRIYTLLQDDAIDIVRDEKNKLWAKFMAVERWAELDNEYPEPYISNDPLIPTPHDLEVIIVGGGSDLSGGRYPVGTAGHALYAVLNGSSWSIGTVDVEGIHDLETEKVSRLQLIKEIQNIWGGYIVWDSVNKKISLRDGGKWQNYTGFQMRYKKNLQHITRTQSNKIITKLYAFGHDDLDIASVNGGKKYVTNNSYTPRTYIGIYKNQGIYNAQELKEKAAAELELICRSRFLYRTKMVDLRTLPEYSHEDFAVGDMVDVVDPDIAPDSPRPRLIRHKYNLFQPWKCEVEIGDPQERLAELLKASFDTTGFVDAKFNGNGKMSGYSIEDLTIASSHIQNLAITNSHIQNLTITGGKIANATITDAKITSLSADKIIANTLMANVNLVIGSGNNVFKANQNGIYLGHANYADAPFHVDMQGNLYAESATISGSISGSSITGSSFTAGNIDIDTDAKVGNNLYLGSVSSNNIKSIYFNDSANISNYKDWSGNPPTGIKINASTTNISGDGLEINALNTYFNSPNIAGIEWGHIEKNPFAASDPSNFADVNHSHSEYVSNAYGIRASNSTKRCYIDLSDDGFLVIRDKDGVDVGHVEII